jgi:hypothetical protein
MLAEVRFHKRGIGAICRSTAVLSQCEQLVSPDRAVITR